MPKQTFHFLNVKEGDCSVIEHASGHVSVIDVCNARKTRIVESFEETKFLAELSKQGNYNQKKNPVNPIEYLQKFGITSVFRFMVTHPDMDHIDGIKDFFEVFKPDNYYDTDNNAEKDFSNNNFQRYREEDWIFYKDLRNTKPQTSPKRITIFSGDDAAYRTKDWDGNAPGDAFYTLAPTPSLVSSANDTKNYNDASYVVLYRSPGGKILFCGDSEDETWNHLIKNHKSDIENIDLMIAPHHGRDSGRNYDFLNITKPKLTFFGNARSEHLAYSAWNNRGLEFITNNQANCMVVDTSGDNLKVYVTYEKFARDRNPYTSYKKEYDAWYLKTIE